jgi:hypothetical protein
MKKIQRISNMERGELLVGTVVELEHTSNPKEALKIAREHISENPNYYKKLYKAGLIDEPLAVKFAKKYF